MFGRISSYVLLLEPQQGVVFLLSPLVLYSSLNSLIFTYSLLLFYSLFIIQVAAVKGHDAAPFHLEQPIDLLDPAPDVPSSWSGDFRLLAGLENVGGVGN